jgi:thiol-disulfide isomerase/thioredoxin
MVRSPQTTMFLSVWGLFALHSLWNGQYHGVNAFSFGPITTTTTTTTTTTRLSRLFVSASLELWTAPSIATTTTATTKTRLAPVITDDTISKVNVMTSIPELLQFMEQGNHRKSSSSSSLSSSSSSSSELVVVHYHANYCKTCQRAGIKLNKLARDFAKISFAKAEVQLFLPTPSQTLNSLGVSRFPFVQIYRRGVRVASFSTGPSHLFEGKVCKALLDCLNRSDEQWSALATQNYQDIQENLQARRQLLQTVQ